MSRQLPHPCTNSTASIIISLLLAASPLQPRCFCPTTGGAHDLASGFHRGTSFGRCLHVESAQHLQHAFLDLSTLQPPFSMTSMHEPQSLVFVAPMLSSVAPNVIIYVHLLYIFVGRSLSCKPWGAHAKQVAAHIVRLIEGDHHLIVWP